MRKFFLLCFCFFMVLALHSQNFHPVTINIDSARFVPYVSHMANVLHKKSFGEIRVLIYGQSISQQDWWKELKRHVEEIYPEEKIKIENRAIGGFSTDRLKLMVENDVFSFYPDIVFLHDYGGHEDYELIIQTIRRLTTADIAVQNDHVSPGQGQEWHDMHSFEWLPSLNKKYGVAYVDVRSHWKNYLSQNNLEASALLSDQVHLNEHGNYLMAEIIKAYFDRIKDNKGSSSKLSILRPKKDFKVNRNSVRLNVTGNRVDVVFNTSSKDSLEIFVGGKDPCSFPGSYYNTRPTKTTNDYFLADIGQLVSMELSPNTEQTYTLIVTDVDSIEQKIKFKLEAAKDGVQGEGWSNSEFLSANGDVKLLPQHWFIRRDKGDFAQFSWLQPGDKLQWEVRCLSKKAIVPVADKAVTVIQKKTAEDIELELKGKSVSAIKEIRVYKP